MQLREAEVSTGFDRPVRERILRLSDSLSNSCLMASAPIIASVGSIPWYVLLAPPVVGALAIRFDAVFIGPYWTFMEVLPGMGSVDADQWYERPTLRFAIARRYLYGIGVGVIAAIWYSDLGIDGAAVVGLVLAGLLLWPIVFHGLPFGILRRDWQLIPLYLSVIASFVAASVVGDLTVSYVRAQSAGDALGWFRDHLLETVFWGGLGFAANAVFGGSMRSLREKKRQREESEDTEENDL
jgi:hypothetical protein